MKEIRILVSYEERIRLMQEAERLNIPLANYLRILIKRELSKKEENRERQQDSKQEEDRKGLSIR